MRIVCWQTILTKYHTLFFQKLGKMSQNLSSAAVVIGALRVKLLAFFISMIARKLDLEVINFFMLNSTEHEISEISIAHKR